MVVQEQTEKYLLPYQIQMKNLKCNGLGGHWIYGRKHVSSEFFA